MRLRSIIPGLLALLLLAASPPRAKEGAWVEVVSAAESTEMEVNLAPLEPLPPPLRAILALYAMRANGGCPPVDWSADGKTYPLKCPFTTALGLGDQCSEAQISLVREWFKDGIPAINLDRKTAAAVSRSRKFEEVCNAVPYSATHQSLWTSIRLRQQGKDRVTVEARGSWTSGPEGESGDFTDVATYRILPDRVKVVSHKGG